MAVLAVTNTFADGNTITASGHNTNFSDIVNYVNNRNDGSATWDALRVTTASAAVAILNNSNGAVNVLNCQDNGTNVLSVADGGATVITATAGGSSVPLTVNNNTSSGNILLAQDNGTTVFLVADGGAVAVGGSPVASSRFSIKAPSSGTTTMLNIVDSTGTETWALQYTDSTGALTFNPQSTYQVVFGADLVPSTAAGKSLGDATLYWNDVSYKTLTDRGCLPWADDGVELQDGRIVSDCEALAAIQKHPTKKTVHDLPMLDYSTFPKVSYRKAEVGGKLLPRDKDGEPVGGQDGVEMTSMFGFMIGAIKELHGRVQTLETK